MRNQKCIRKTISADTGIKSFLDMIAPSVVKFNPDHFICGNTFRCVWALREYPTQTDEQALLRHLGEKDGITLRIYTRQLTPVEEDRSSKMQQIKTVWAARTQTTCGRRSPLKAIYRMWHR